MCIRDSAFTAEDGAFGVYTLWIETEFNNDIEPWEGEVAPVAGDPRRQTVAVEVAGRRIEVTMPANLIPLADQDVTRGPAPKRARGASVTGASGDAVTAPMQATVIKVCLLYTSRCV